MKYILLCSVIILLLGGQAKGWRRRRRRPSPRNCRLSSWSSWTRCSHECGNAGTQRRTRHKLENECCGGVCFPLREERSCNRHCHNGGIAFFGRCSCKGGYTGICCETDICSTRPCPHKCVNLGHSYSCQCHSCFSKIGTKCVLQKCKIGEKCFEYGDVNPSNPCQQCRQGRETAWTNNNVLSCNDSNQCTVNDRCVDGVCRGTPITCKSCESCDGNACRLNPGYCIVDGRCYKKGVERSGDPCQAKTCKDKSQDCHYSIDCSWLVPLNWKKDNCAKTCGVC